MLRRAILSAVFCAAASPAFAGPVEVAFEPPEVDIEPVCTARPPVHVLRARWDGWDGGALPEGDRPVSLIRRDLRLLRQDNPTRWFDTIEAAQARLVDVVPDYDETDRRLDRIDLLVDARRFDQMREEGLDAWLLEEAAGSASSRLMTTAAELLYSGKGVDRDRDRAAALWRRAAYAGHAGALIEMARLSSEGSVEDWDIAPEIAMTMAFGAMLGEVDERVCDRINRIADHYRLGRVVTEDHPLAERWYRLSARLGGANAAWRVAQLHLEGSTVERDIDVALAHLEQAADAGFTYAMTELAGILELGALTDRDIAGAQALYEQAAELGSDTALIRLINLERAQAPGENVDNERLQSLLTRLVDRPVAPAWAFVQLGDLALAEKGRWAGEDEASELYDRALEIDSDHSAALMRRAQLDLRKIDGQQDFETIVASFRQVVKAEGLSAPMQSLSQAYLCRAPSAPLARDARFWDEMEQFSGDETIDLTVRQLRNLSAETSPVLLAHLQAQAVNRRARPVANFVVAAREEGDEGAMQGLLDFAFEEADEMYLAQARVDRRLGKTDAAEAHLRDAVEAGEPGAKMELIEHLQTHAPDNAESREEILTLARPLAENGIGRAIRAVIEADPDMTEARAWDLYRDAIARNGDFEALVFALPFLEDGETQAVYADRARAVMDCRSQNAMTLAAALDDVGQEDPARRWMAVARATADPGGWQGVAVADMILERGLAETPLAEAEEMYRAAAAEGYPLAMRRLLDLRGDDQIDLPLDEAADMYTGLLTAENLEQAVSGIEMLGFADATLREEVEDRVDTGAILEDAADAGLPRAELVLAKRLRAGAAEGGPELERSTELLQSAAEKGEPEAMRLLSAALAYGIGTTPDPEASRRWLIRASEAGDAEAQSLERLLGGAPETDEGENR